MEMRTKFGWNLVINWSWVKYGHKLDIEWAKHGFGQKLVKIWGTLIREEHQDLQHRVVDALKFKPCRLARGLIADYF